MSECVKSKTSNECNERTFRVARLLSLPAFQILSKKDKKPPGDSYTEFRIPLRERRVKSDSEMKDDANVVSAHHPSSRSKRISSSRHDRHKCHHKSKHKTFEMLQFANQALTDRVNELKREKFELTKRLNASVTSVDSGLSTNEVLSPFEMDVTSAYQLVKCENSKLLVELDKFKSRCSQLENHADKVERENKDLGCDVNMLKCLVYKLNMELERYQTGNVDQGNGQTNENKIEILPKNYQKNFLRPVLPLLKAYSEAVQEKSEMIENFENDIKKFGTVFNDLLKENEKLYQELEKKMNSVEGDALNEMKVLKKDLEMTKQENTLLLNQIELEQEKLAEVHSVYRMKVAEVLKQNETVNENLQQHKADLYVMQGKYSILKQEFERLKVDNDSRVPMAVHSASIGECKRLFQDLKNEYETQRQRHLSTISEQEQALTKLRMEHGDRLTERSQLEKCNSENESLKRRIAEFEERMGEKRMDRRDQGEIISIRRQLRESNVKVEELSNKLANTKKQLHKAMSFAEDIVREQESLLMQLHAKQKENTFMVTQFGSLKRQLKSVEKGAQEDLNTVEERMKSLECENSRLTSEIRKMRSIIKERDEIINKLEREKISDS